MLQKAECHCFYKEKAQINLELWKEKICDYGIFHILLDTTNYRRTAVKIEHGFQTATRCVYWDKDQS